MIQAVLSNGQRPEYGTVTVSFPISREEYDCVMEQLASLEIGDPSKQDCIVNKIDGFFTVLKITEGHCVNVDELDYLAKRLDSFNDGEAAQFQAMASKMELFEPKDLINLTFCCQQATVITDFSNLEAIGRDHYMNTHGGCADIEELENLDGTETALLLITENEGTVTPYGVVYDNGMRLERSYDGKHFPAYLYESSVLMVALSSRLEPEDTRNITWLYLPAAEGQIRRAIDRSGISNPENTRFRVAESMLPEEVDAALDFRQEGIYALNELAREIKDLSKSERKKLGAAVVMARPEGAAEICRLAENLELFDFAPGVHTPEEYGQYMIRESGRFVYDSSLDEFYDYERYGRERLERERGMFTDQGYISYHGALSLEELVMGDPAERYQRERGLRMGGMG